MKHFQTSDGLKLAYRDEGAGVPVLCLPGLSRNSGDFDPVAVSFSSVARIIRLDLRGRGASDYDADFTNYNVLVEARDVVEFLDHLKLERVAILGTSRGGLIALMLAAMAPERLMGIVFNDIGPHIERVGLERIMSTLGVIPPEPTLKAFGERLVEETAGAFPGVTAEKWQSFMSNVMRETPDGLELRYDEKIKDAVQTSLEDGNWPDLWPVFDLCEGLPLLLLRGEFSDVLSKETSEEMCNRRPDMRYVVVRNRGHIPFLDEPEAQEALGEFIDALPR